MSRRWAHGPNCARFPGAQRLVNHITCALQSAGAAQDVERKRDESEPKHMDRYNNVRTSFVMNLLNAHEYLLQLLGVAQV